MKVVFKSQVTGPFIQKVKNDWKDYITFIGNKWTTVFSPTPEHHLTIELDNFVKVEKEFPTYLQNNYDGEYIITTKGTDGDTE